VPPDNNLNKPVKYETYIGSQTIYYMLKNSGILTEFYLDCQMYHGLDNDCDCDPNPFNKDPITHNCTINCKYQSDFGFSTNIDEADTYNYIVGRAATFFQTILGGNTSHITTSRFVECPNDRVGCLGDTQTGCSDTTECPN
jgi:hypothetical protein